MATQRKLGRTADQRKALLRNQVTNLIWYGRIETTLARAKEVRSVAEKMITLAVREYDKTVDVQKLADDLKNNVPYSADMIATAEEDLNYKLDPPEGTTIAGYMADGNAYDMIVVGQCASADDAKTLYTNVQTYLNDLKTEANRYQPEEEARLNDALLRQDGTVVVLCVSDDTAAATAIVEGYVK